MLVKTKSALQRIECVSVTNVFVARHSTPQPSSL
jgi:hypothetical protein